MIKQGNEKDKFELTHAQYDVLERLSRGEYRGKIAEDIGLSIRTVECHIFAIYNRLGLKGVDRREGLIIALFLNQPYRFVRRRRPRKH